VGDEGDFHKIQGLNRQVLSGGKFGCKKLKNILKTGEHLVKNSCWNFNLCNGNSLRLAPPSQNCPKAKFSLPMKKLKTSTKKEQPEKLQAPPRKVEDKKEKRQAKASARQGEDAQPNELFWDGYSDIGYC